MTTPHSWIQAFGRYFAGPDSLNEQDDDLLDEQDDKLRTDKRAFCRLTALASWRSEYILRTRLLRSLGRGKPIVPENTSGNPNIKIKTEQTPQSVVTYGSLLNYPISHIHGVFGNGLGKKKPLFYHGASEQGWTSRSDPSLGRIPVNSLAGIETFRHFADFFSGDAEWGLGAGDVAGHPNVMDLSQPHGLIYGEACPGGRAYFLGPDERRGRFLPSAGTVAQAEKGMPNFHNVVDGVCSVWIAKSPEIVATSKGVVGFMTGSATGVLSVYSLGTTPTSENRYSPAQVTARWALSPGVPIISIQVDDDYSLKRQSQHRIWAVVVNALGEIFYLTELPVRFDDKLREDPVEIETLAWSAGRKVQWTLVDVSRRTARPDPYGTAAIHGSYSPWSSSDAMKLNSVQIAAETLEIETFIKHPPKHFRKVCEGWDMQRRVLVDFTGDDGHGAGESVTILSCGLAGEESASGRRFTRCRALTKQPFGGSSSTTISRPSLFGGKDVPTAPGSPPSVPRSRTSSVLADGQPSSVLEQWRMSDLDFNGIKSVHITASAIDMSNFAKITKSEDPLLGMSGGSVASSSASSPMPHMMQPGSAAEIPGQRARFIAAGTSTGAIFLWDVRAAFGKSPDHINSLPPVRIVYTDSPQISCIALTSLYLVHGGNDGLVQAWDPLASTTRPIRTLNSRFSSRARRRLVQAEASAMGVGNNFYAAGAISLDPDSTVLRGMVSLGTHLRYWAYSSLAADQYKTSKRRLRRGDRGSNGASTEHRITASGRGALLAHIENEHAEMIRDQEARRREAEHLNGRFGVDLLGPDASEEELLAYAQMLSEETYTSDERKRRGSHAVSSSDGTIGPFDSSFAVESSNASVTVDTGNQDLDPDLAEAIRLSLQENNVPSAEDYAPSDLYESQDVGFEIPVRYAKPRHTKSSKASSSKQHTPLPQEQPFPSATAEGSSNATEMSDLEFALQLSLAEEESRRQKQAEMEALYGGEFDSPAVEDGDEDFPGLPSSANSGKGKGKGKATWSA